jgi:hypothetical protein
MNDAGTQRRVPFSWRKLLLWTILLAADLVFFGCRAELYAAAVVAVSVASIAVMRRILGLWAAYLTALPIGAVGVFCAVSAVGGTPENVCQLLEEVLLCAVFGTIPGLVLFGVTCLLQFVVTSLDVAPPSETRASKNEVAGSSQ